LPLLLSFSLFSISPFLSFVHILVPSLPLSISFSLSSLHFSPSLSISPSLFFSLSPSQCLTHLPLYISLVASTTHTHTHTHTHIPTQTSILLKAGSQLCI